MPVISGIWLDIEGRFETCGNVFLAEPEGFEPSIGLYNPITV
jgi:hypothetical protein